MTTMTTMFCSNCCERKPLDQFRSPIGQLLAYCADCRAAIVRGNDARAAPPRVHRPAGDRAFVLHGVPSSSEPNVRLIKEAGIARDLAWFFELNGFSNAKR